MRIPPMTQAITDEGPASCAAYIEANSHPDPITLPRPVATRDQNPSVRLSLASSPAAMSKSVCAVITRLWDRTDGSAGSGRRPWVALLVDLVEEPCPHPVILPSAQVERLPSGSADCALRGSMPAYTETRSAPLGSSSMLPR